MDLDIVSSVQENHRQLLVRARRLDGMPVGAMVKKFRAEFEEVIERARMAEPGGGMSPDRPEITLVVDGVEVKAREGEMLVDAAKGGDVEIPVFCYEPKLGAPVGACRMCLVEVEDPEAPDGVLDPGARRDGGLHPDRPGPGGPERSSSSSSSTTARLPGLRQGRRVPAAGHRDGLGSRGAAG